MSYKSNNSFLKNSYRGPALAALVVMLTSPVALTSASKPPYQTAPVETVKEQIISPSQKLGEFDGDSYYFKSAGMGTGQIYRVSNSDPTKYAAVGLILSNKYQIQDAEKTGFYAVVTDKPASALTGSGGQSGAPSQVQPETAQGSCTATTGAYYLSGSNWLAMTRADTANDRGVSIKGELKDLARNPWSSMPGRTNTMLLTNAAAHITVGPTAQFCMGVPVATSTDNMFIEMLDVKGDHREVEMLLSGNNKKDMTKRLHKVSVRRLSDTTIQVTPQEPLPPGQYILAGRATSGIGAYDFGVQ